MFRRIPNVLTEDHARLLASTVGPRDLFEPAIRPLITSVLSVVSVGLNYPAYCVVEQKPEGHGWHTDRGNNGHMPWCRYSASVLLTDPSSFTGGLFHTGLPGVEHATYHHYLDMLIYSSNVVHMVDPHEGDRRALLMFFA